MWKFYEIKHGWFLFISLLIKGSFYISLWRLAKIEGAIISFSIIEHILTCNKKSTVYFLMKFAQFEEWIDGTFCESFKSGSSLIFKCPIPQWQLIDQLHLHYNCHGEDVRRNYFSVLPVVSHLSMHTLTFFCAKCDTNNGCSFECIKCRAYVNNSHNYPNPTVKFRVWYVFNMFNSLLY